MTEGPMVQGVIEARHHVHDYYANVEECINLVDIKIDSSLQLSGQESEEDAGGSSLQITIEMPTRYTERKQVARHTFGVVRPELRLDYDVYVPHSVSIGPYHVYRRSSPGVENDKMSSFDFMWNLTSGQEPDLVALMTTKLEPLARACYGDGIDDMTPEQFTTMLLLDACYLLNFFVDYGGPRPTAVSHHKVLHDTVFLVENQIPLLVLQGIHELVTGGNSPVLDCIAGPVQELLRKMLFISNKTRPAPTTLTDSHHLLHLLHTYLQPRAAGDININNVTTASGRWRRATEYRNYGDVSFKRLVLADGEESSLLDVQLRRGTLWIPRLRVDANTWTVLRNLMALEEQEEKKPVTAYCLLMSQVACTAEDVELLRRAGIVDHYLNNDEHAAQGFAGLCSGVAMDADDIHGNYLGPMWHEMEERCNSPLHNFLGFFPLL